MKNHILLGGLLTGLFLVVSAQTHLLAFSSETNQRNITVAQQTKKLHIPGELCFLQRSNESDRRVIDMTERSIQGVNRVLALFTNCKELKKWRAGKTTLLDNIGNVQVSIRSENQKFKSREKAIIKEICDLVAKNEKKLYSDLDKEIKDRVKSVSKTIRINENKPLGIFSRGPTHCITGLLQSIKTEIGSRKLLLGSIGFWVLDETLIYSYYFKDYHHDMSLKDYLVEVQKKIMTLTKKTID